MLRIYLVVLLTALACHFTVSMIPPVLEVWSHRFTTVNPYLTSSIMYTVCMIATLTTCLFCAPVIRGRRVKTVIALGLLCYLVSCISVIISESLFSIIIMRVLQGVGAALTMISLMHLIGSHHDESTSLRLYSVYNAGIGLGFVLGSLGAAPYQELQNLVFSVPIVLILVSLALDVIVIGGHMRFVTDALRMDVPRVRGDSILVLLSTFLIVGYVAALSSLYPPYAKTIGFDVRHVSSLLSLMWAGYVIAQAIMRQHLVATRYLAAIALAMAITFSLIYVAYDYVIAQTLFFGLGLCVGIGITLTMALSRRASIRPEHYVFTLYLSMAVTPYVMTLLASCIGIVLSCMLYSLVAFALLCTLYMTSRSARLRDLPVPRQNLSQPPRQLSDSRLG